MKPEVTLDVSCSLNETHKQIAYVLCQCIFDGDMALMRRYIKAGVDIDIGDYDQRTALHIAAAEVNLPAVGTSLLSLPLPSPSPLPLLPLSPSLLPLPLPSLLPLPVPMLCVLHGCIASWLHSCMHRLAVWAVGHNGMRLEHSETSVRQVGPILSGLQLHCAVGFCSVYLKQGSLIVFERMLLRLSAHLGHRPHHVICHCTCKSDMLGRCRCR